MPTEEQNERVESLARYVFFGALAFTILALIVQWITGNQMLAGRIFVTAVWVAVAMANFATFYTGRLRWKRGPALTRECSPIDFYAAALFNCAGSMSIGTFFLWKAYTSE